MLENLKVLMREATRLSRSGRLQDATRAIQRALNGIGGARSAASRDVVEGHAVELDGRPVGKPRDPARTPVMPRAEAGEFTAGVHHHASLTRHYKLYVPPGAAGRRLPLVVMLHGCTQDPDDFAAGTGMNERARKQGFCVLYPAQAKDANPQRCWNWFKHNHQQRGSGEPALIADLTLSVIKAQGLDARRVYIAGLSAGGAMAAIVAAAYPDIYAAVGVHSGLPRGAAHDVAGAFTAMKTGAAAPSRRAAARHEADTSPQAPVPTIVFHGDVDQTVHPNNAELVIAAALGAVDPAAPAPSPRPAKVEQGITPLGRRYTRSTHHGGHGRVVAEHWLVHGAGHAWSGGQAQGSYTDASGPDASGEMLRFFFEHPHRPGR